MDIIGISGASCSGKSTLASQLKKRLGSNCEVINIDNYYFPSELPFQKRAMINHDIPEAHDWRLLKNHVLKLKSGESIESPVYSYREHNRRDDTIIIYPSAVLIIEGIHALHDPGILNKLTIKVFLDSTSEDRKQRRIKRDLSERSSSLKHVVNKYNQQTEPTFKEYEATLRSRAEIIAANLDDAESRILSMLSNNAPKIFMLLMF